MSQMPTLGTPVPLDAMPTPNLGAVDAQMYAARRQQMLAQALQSTGYVPNSGGLGALAQIVAAWKGGKIEKRADETIAQALQRKFEAEQRAAAESYTRDRSDKREDAIFSHQLSESSTPAELKTLRTLLENPDLAEMDLRRRAAIANATRAPQQPSALQEKIGILQGLGAGTDQIRDSILDLPAPPTPKMRALPNTVVERMAKQADIGTNLVDMTGSFQDKYAGNTITGGLETLAGRIGGERVGLADEGQADWWQQYDRQKNEVRNALFGSALTPSEQTAFEKADINPRMDPKRIRANLAMQQQIIRRGLARRADVYRKQGFDPDAIEAATMIPGGSAAPAAAAPAPAAAPQGPIAVNPQTGEKLHLVNGAWVPLQ